MMLSEKPAVIKCGKIGGPEARDIFPHFIPASKKL